MTIEHFIASPPDQALQFVAGCMGNGPPPDEFLAGLKKNFSRLDADHLLPALMLARDWAPDDFIDESARHLDSTDTAIWTAAYRLLNAVEVIRPESLSLVREYASRCIADCAELVRQLSDRCRRQDA